MPHARTLSSFFCSSWLHSKPVLPWISGREKKKKRGGNPHVHGLAWLPDSPDVQQVLNNSDDASTARKVLMHFGRRDLGSSSIGRQHYKHDKGRARRAVRVVLHKPLNCAKMRTCLCFFCYFDLKYYCSFNNQ